MGESWQDGKGKGWQGKGKSSGNNNSAASLFGGTDVFSRMVASEMAEHNKQKEQEALSTVMAKSIAKAFGIGEKFAASTDGKKEKKHEHFGYFKRVARALMNRTHHPHR